MHTDQARRGYLFISVSICLFLSLSACTGSSMLSKKETATQSQRQPVKDENAPRYHDFSDVLVPAKLKIDNDSSYIIKSSGFITGVLVLNGRVDRDALIGFFKTNMVKDNWKTITTFKSPRTDTFLLFHKPQRWCIISISESDFSTHVELAVAPANETEPSGLFK